MNISLRRSSQYIDGNKLGGPVQLRNVEVKRFLVETELKMFDEILFYQSHCTPV